MTQEYSAESGSLPRGDSSPSGQGTAATGLKDSVQQAAESVNSTAAGAAATVKDEVASSARDVRDQAQAVRDTATNSRR